MAVALVRITQPRAERSALSELEIGVKYEMSKAWLAIAWWGAAKGGDYRPSNQLESSTAVAAMRNKTTRECSRIESTVSNLVHAGVKNSCKAR